MILVDANLLIYAWNARAPEHEAARTWLEERLNGFLESLLEKVDRPNLVPDAHLAALALEYGLVLCSADRDFARFSELAWENPLQG